MGTNTGHFTVLQYKNLIRMLNGRGSLRNDKYRRAAFHFPNGSAQSGICGIIQGRSAVVQNKNFRFAGQCSCYGKNIAGAPDSQVL